MKQKIARIISVFFIAYYKLRYGKRVQFGKGVIINHRFKLRGKGTLRIGDGVRMWAHEEKNRFQFYSPEATIEIGAGSRLNGVFCHAYDSITIGKNCMIGSATLMDTDFHTFDDPTHVLYGKPLSKPIVIEDGTWLAGQCVILKGVTMGQKSVVGFRAVVTKSFPDNVVVAGNPARVVREASSSSPKEGGQN